MDEGSPKGQENIEEIKEDFYALELLIEYLDYILETAEIRTKLADDSDPEVGFDSGHKKIAEKFKAGETVIAFNELQALFLRMWDETKNPKINRPRVISELKGVYTSTRGEKAGKVKVLLDKLK